jgi:hypothetical protein
LPLSLGEILIVNMARAFLHVCSTCGLAAGLPRKMWAAR